MPGTWLQAVGRCQQARSRSARALTQRLKDSRSCIERHKADARSVDLKTPDMELNSVQQTGFRPKGHTNHLRFSDIQAFAWPTPGSTADEILFKARVSTLTAPRDRGPLPRKCGIAGASVHSRRRPRPHQACPPADSAQPMDCVHVNGSAAVRELRRACAVQFLAFSGHNGRCHWLHLLLLL
jgi:hypothetical protein